MIRTSSQSTLLLLLWRCLTFHSVQLLAPCALAAINGEFVVNPTYAERALTTVNIMVVGHKDGIVMIESGAKEETEDVILAAIEFAHGEIKKIVAAIDELAAKAGKTKRTFAAPEFDEAYYAELKTKVGDRLEGCAGYEDSRQDRELCVDQEDQG